MFLICSESYRSFELRLLVENLPKATKEQRRLSPKNTNNDCKTKVATLQKTRKCSAKRNVTSGQNKIVIQQTQGFHSMLDHCWAGVVDGGSVLIHHWMDLSCFAGKFHVYKEKANYPRWQVRVYNIIEE